MCCANILTTIMNKTIYAGGDSFTAGYPMGLKYSWPTILGNKLNVTVDNDSRSGSSNYRIYRRALEHIITGNYDVVILCWTALSRTELSVSNTSNKPGRIHQLRAEESSPASKKFYKNNYNVYLQYGDFLRMLISMQNITKQYNTSLLMFDGLGSIPRPLTFKWFNDEVVTSQIGQYMDDNLIKKKFQKLTKLNNEVEYNNFMFNDSFRHIVRNIIDPKEHTDPHPGINKQYAMAELIFNYMQKNTRDKI